MVEERQDVMASAPQGAAELGDLLQSCGHAAADRFDQPGHRQFAGAPVRVGVGGDDLLVDHVGDLDGDVLVGVEHAAQPVVLAGREQLGSLASAARTVLREIPNVRAIILIGNPSARCKRRISAQSSTDNNSLLLSAHAENQTKGVKIRASTRGHFSDDADTSPRRTVSGVRSASL